MDDIILGVYGARSSGMDGSGSSYVVFGRGAGSLWPAEFELADVDGTNGFRLDGIDRSDQSGTSVASAGDVNGDGIDDVIVGAPSADPGGRAQAGEAYVVFGRPPGSLFPASMSLADLDGTNGFRLDGVKEGDWTGFSTAPAGDMNGDGLDDVIIGAVYAGTDMEEKTGAAYVVFGRDAGSPFPAVVSLADLNGLDGFRVQGVDEFNLAAISVSPAGDVNGDGRDDIILGAPGATAVPRRPSGAAYVVFGRRYCLADVDGDGELSLFDFLAFQNLFMAGDPAADFDRDGALTIFDFLAFQNAFDAGCG